MKKSDDFLGINFVLRGKETVDLYFEAKERLQGELGPRVTISHPVLLTELARKYLATTKHYA
jgi:hypothetical protein